MHYADCDIRSRRERRSGEQRIASVNLWLILPTMKFFGKKHRPQELVTNGRFELERDGQIAYLEYSLAGTVLALIHSEVPEKLRGHGLAHELAHTALQYARENHLKVDVICPSVAKYLEDHPEYSDLLLR